MTGPQSQPVEGDSAEPGGRQSHAGAQPLPQRVSLCLVCASGNRLASCANSSLDVLLLTLSFSLGENTEELVSSCHFEIRTQPGVIVLQDRECPEPAVHQPHGAHVSRRQQQQIGWVRTMRTTAPFLISALSCTVRFSQVHLLRISNAARFLFADGLFQ